MNIFLWALQILLAVHTTMGAVWKFFNPEQNVPSLQAIPHAIWLGMGIAEFIISVALLIPVVYRPVSILTPIAALAVAAEMLFMCAVHLRSGAPNYGPMIYWLVVAGICGFLAYARFALEPI
jgi:uncharacterized membrane protein